VSKAPRHGGHGGEISQEEGDTMLVLSRKKNESIVINNDITVVVVEIRGDKVRLGVEAPSDIPVHRHEVQEALERNKQLAKGAGPTTEEEQTGSAPPGDSPPSQPS